MVAYNFKPQFVPLVETGAKQQTIRSPRKRHTKPGEAIQLYTGMRTKACRKLVTPDPLCLSVELLLMHDKLGIKLNDRWLTKEALTRLALADGFTAWDECLCFFSAVHQLGAQIPWKHNCAILDKLKDPEQRVWYIQKTIEHGWSRNVLMHQIDTDLYSRQSGALTNFQAVLPAPQSGLAQSLLKSEYSLLKSEYNLEFLDLREKAKDWSQVFSIISINLCQAAASKK